MATKLEEDINQSLKTMTGTLVLRNTAEMLVDTWVDNKGWITLRKVKFSADGLGDEVKINVIRLSPEEAKSFCEYIAMTVEI